MSAMLMVGPQNRGGHGKGRRPALYALFSGWLLYVGFRDEAHLLPWLGGVIASALGAYAWPHWH